MIKSTSSLSHEIRTPLNAIIGFTDLLILQDPSPEQLEFLNAIKSSGNSLLSLINDVLDLNKVEQEKGTTPIKHLEITQTINGLSGIKVLIAEDNIINTLLIKQFMELWGVAYDFAENGVQAVKKVQESRYDLILMDLQMPEMDGFEASRAIRGLENVTYKSLPIIALSASYTDDIKEKTAFAGIDDFISKPFNPNDLYEKISYYSSTSQMSNKTPQSNF